MLDYFELKLFKAWMALPVEPSVHKVKMSPSLIKLRGLKTKTDKERLLTPTSEVHFGMKRLKASG